MNEVTGSVHCPQCDTLNTLQAAHCGGCGALLGRPTGRESSAMVTQVLRRPQPGTPPDSSALEPPYEPPLEPRPDRRYAPPQGASDTQYPTPQPYQDPPARPAPPPASPAFQTQQMQMQPYPQSMQSPYPYQQGYAPPQPYQGAPNPAQGYSTTPQPYQPPYGPPQAYQTHPMGAQPYPPYAPPQYPAQGYAQQAPPYQQYGPAGPYMSPVSVNVSPVINVQNPVTVNIPEPAPPPKPVVVVNTAPSGPSMAVRVLWFLFIGLPLGLVSTVLGWALCVAVITLPLGLGILHSLPAIMTLRPASKTTQVIFSEGVTVINTDVGAEQLPFLVRAIYFLLVGWWFSALWLGVAWVLVVLSIVTFGLSLAPAFMMFERVPQVLTLREN